MSKNLNELSSTSPVDEMAAALEADLVNVNREIVDMTRVIETFNGLKALAAGTPAETSLNNILGMAGRHKADLEDYLTRTTTALSAYRQGKERLANMRQAALQAEAALDRVINVGSAYLH